MTRRTLLLSAVAAPLLAAAPLLVAGPDDSLPCFLYDVNVSGPVPDVDVFVDGERTTHVVRMATGENGFVYEYVTDRRGQVYLTPDDEPAMRMRRGRVEVRQKSTGRRVVNLGINGTIFT